MPEHLIDYMLSVLVIGGGPISNIEMKPIKSKMYTLSSNIPSSPAYGVFISQFIRYAKSCSSDEYFILRAVRFEQGYFRVRFEVVSREVLLSIWGSHQTL